LAFILFDEEIRKSAALFWFGLQDVGILYSRAVVQGIIDLSRIFEARLGGKIAVWVRANHDLHEAAQNFELLSNIQDQK
jgi:hypothetical protein